MEPVKPVRWNHKTKEFNFRMLSSKLLYIPIILEILIVGFDEVYYHNRRELTRQEQIGHAFDTITVWVCLALILAVPPTYGSALVYAFLSAFSCLFITKDEFQFHKACQSGERWLHGMAYLLHPLFFISAGLLWPAMYHGVNSPRILEVIQYSGEERHFILVNAIMLILFAAYEFVPRNLIWRNEKVAFDLSQ
jgi:hypothetical protein